MKYKLLLLMSLSILLISNVKAVETVDEANTFSCNNLIYTKVANGWYQVEKNEEGNYIIVGNIIEKNPCENNDNNEQTPTKPETPNKDNNDKPNNTEPPKETKPKSSDTSIKMVMIDNDEIDLDKLAYSTKKSSVAIKVVANDNKATVNYSKSKKLVVGKNTVVFTVTAEDGTKKEYKVVITREKQSNNTKVTIKVSGKNVKFNNHESSIFYVSHDVKSLDISYKLEDKKSNIEIIGNDSLIYGENKIIVKVIAEDDTEEIFTINVYKYEKDEELVNNIFAIVVIVLFVSAIGYYIVKIINSNRTVK